MRYGHNHLAGLLRRKQNPEQSPWGRQNFRWLTLAAMMLVTFSAYALQDSPALQAVTRGHSNSAKAARHQESYPKAENLDQYKPLLEELGRLQEKLAQGVQFPAPRNHSRLLPLLPGSSSFFVALPNYGEALYQANQIFHQQLQESPVLNGFWQNKVGMAGLMVDDAIDKTHQLLQFLGDEIVVSGTVKASGPTVLIIAEARKPGLKAFIQQVVGQYADKTRPPVLVYNPQQLVLAKKQPSYKPLLILVRPDFIVASSDLAALKNFNTHLSPGGGRFTDGPFGQRIEQAYQGGAGVVYAADLHQLLGLRPHQTDKDEAAFTQSGYADLKYLVGGGQYAGGVASNNLELSFMGPRKGLASWLGAPAPLTGLDFVSPDAAYAGAFNLKSPGEMLDDIKSFAGSYNPMADVGLAQMEAELKINLKDDLFSKLAGEIAFAVDGPIMPIPAWKVIVKLSDSNGLERTLKQLLAVVSAKEPEGLKLGQEVEGGVSYYSLHFTGGQNPIDVNCAFVDGYLVVAGSREAVKAAIRIRKSGNSLAQARELQELLPRDRGNNASGIIYQNLGRALGSMVQQMPPDQAQLFQLLAQYSKPSITNLYGSEDAIRIVSRGYGIDPSIALVAAAVTIPNLMRAKNAANEAAAAANVRTLTSAEVMYETTYNKGYASDLATLGGGNCEGSSPSETHACLIDGTLGCKQKWCFKDGYRYNVAGSCNNQTCDDFVIVASPVDSSVGRRKFCSTSDGVVRGQSGSPSASPISVSECQSWQPL